MKYIFGAASIFLIKFEFLILKYNFRRNFGIHLLIMSGVLYFSGITCLSILQIDGERLNIIFMNILEFLNSDNNKTLWMLGIFSIIVIDSFIDLSLIFLLHLFNISYESKLWVYLICNGFTERIIKTVNLNNNYIILI